MDEREERATAFHIRDARWRTYPPAKLLAEFAESEITRTLDALAKDVESLRGVPEHRLIQGFRILIQAARPKDGK